MRASHQALRALGLVLAILLLASTAWVLLTLAVVVLMSRWMGTGLALLAAGGGLALLLAIILLVASITHRKEPRAPDLVRRILPAVLGQGGKALMGHPLFIRAGLLTIGVAFALAAALTGASPKDPDKPS